MISFAQIFKLLPLAGCLVVMAANAADCPGPGCPDPIHLNAEKASRSTQPNDCPGKGCVDSHWGSTSEKANDCPGKGCADYDEVTAPEKAVVDKVETKPTKKVKKPKEKSLE